MTTLDDKLLGEKRENYCSSSEDEGHEEEEGSSSSTPPPATSPLTKNEGLSGSKIDINDTSRWKGYSQNTGPKGVIRDWQLYKEHEAQARLENEAKLAEEIKKHTITCRSYQDDVDAELEELMSDEVLKGFVNKRMGELMKTNDGGVKQFKELLNGDDFLGIIDEFGARDEKVVVLIYDESNVSSRLVDGLKECSVKYRDTQFSCIKANCVGVSQLFKRKGVPAVLVYSRGELVGNYVRVVGEIGEEFDSEDLSEWLEGKGIVGKKAIRGPE